MVLEPQISDLLLHFAAGLACHALQPRRQESVTHAATELLSPGACFKAINHTFMSMSAIALPALASVKSMVMLLSTEPASKVEEAGDDPARSLLW